MRAATRRRSYAGRVQLHDARSLFALVLTILWLVGLVLRGDLALPSAPAAHPTSDPAQRFDHELAAIRDELPATGAIGFFAGSSEELIAQRPLLHAVAAAIAQLATDGELPPGLPAEHVESVRRLARDAHTLFEPGAPFAGRPMDAPTIYEGLVYLAAEASKGRSLPLSQFALAPLVLRTEWDGGLVLGHFPDAEEWRQHPRAAGLRLVRRLDAKRLLFEATR